MLSRGSRFRGSRDGAAIVRRRRVSHGRSGDEVVVRREEGVVETCRAGFAKPGYASWMKAHIGVASTRHA